MTTEVEQPSFARDDIRAWSRWLRTLIVLLGVFCAAVYSTLVLIDPFSTGRFALTQRIDRVSNDTWYWFAKAGLIRDQQFDTIILGSSVAAPLDPVHIGELTGRKVLQFALYGAFPQHTLAVSRAYERYRGARHPLRIVVLDEHWCAPTLPSVDYRVTQYPEFPFWLYGSSNIEYLSGIISSFAVRTAVGRVGIWLGLRGHSIRADGYASIVPPNFDPAATAAKLLAVKQRSGGAPVTAPFPLLDALAEHLGAIDQGSPVLLMHPPVFVNALPAPGSAAAARVAACKAKIIAIASARANTAVLDLYTDNPLARQVSDYFDLIHFWGETARAVEREIARAAIELQSRIR